MTFNHLKCCPNSPQTEMHIKTAPGSISLKKISKNLKFDNILY